RAKECASACMEYFRDDSPNRLIFLGNYFLLSMRSGDYIESSQIFNLATKNSRLQEMPATNQDKWKIFEMYLYFVEKKENKENENKFNLHKTLNEIHVYEKDKRGFNIAILIVQICILINKAPIDKIEALKLYRRRYLKSDVNYRVGVFMDLLFALDKADYTVSLMRKEESTLLKKLESKPMDYAENIEGMEVIPFEKLWEMVRSNIEHN